MWMVHMAITTTRYLIDQNPFIILYQCKLKLSGTFHWNLDFITIIPNNRIFFINLLLY